MMSWWFWIVLDQPCPKSSFQRHMSSGQHSSKTVTPHIDDRFLPAAWFSCHLVGCSWFWNQYRWSWWTWERTSRWHIATKDTSCRHLLERQRTQITKHHGTMQNDYGRAIHVPLSPIMSSLICISKAFCPAAIFLEAVEINWLKVAKYLGVEDLSKQSLTVE